MKGPKCSCPVGVGGKRVHSIGCPIHGLGTPEVSATRKRNLGRGTSLPVTSEKQDDRQAFLDGVKYERLRAMKATFGECFCEVSRLVEVSGIESNDEDAGIVSAISADGCLGKSLTCQQAIDLLVLHHIRKRSQGPRYVRGKGAGVDDPDNLILVCDPCHRRIEGR